QTHRARTTPPLRDHPLVPALRVRPPPVGTPLGPTCMKIELVEGAKRPSLPEAPPVKRDQPLPVALRGRLVVAPPLRERKAVMNPGIEFDFTGSAGPRKQGPELLDHRQRRQLVVFSASNVELALHLAQREMGALFGLADEPGSVEGSSGGDAVRITRGRGEGVGTAHT